MKRLLPLAIVFVSCAESGVFLGHTQPPADDRELVRARVVDIPPTFADQLDVLFVVDNSPDSAEVARLMEGFPELLRRLQHHRRGVAPSIHVGVTSSDMGVGNQAVPGCSTSGDSGRLNATADHGDDSRISGADYIDLTQRYSGHRFLKIPEGAVSLERFAPQLRRFTAYDEPGCKFEQPLRAMTEAVFAPANSGFVRESANLAVVFLTNDDDCSVASDRLFEPTGEFAEDGVPTKYRCFNDAVTCAIEDVSGRFEQCAPDHRAQHMSPLERYTDFLSRIKFDPRSVVVGGSLVSSRTVQVDLVANSVQPRCTGGYPAPRMMGFMDAIPEGVRAATADFCQSPARWDPSLLGRQIRKSMGTRCLDYEPVDIDETTATPDYDCQVWDEHPNGAKVPLPECEYAGFAPHRSSVKPCYSIRRGPALCGDFPTQAALTVCRGEDESGCVSTRQPMGVHTVASCLVEARSVPELAISTTTNVSATAASSEVFYR